MPSADIEQLFRPTSASVRQLLSDHVGGFSIPSYQRPYRWQPQDIKRLLEDLLNGLRRLKADPEAVTFIGAIITLSEVSDHHHTRPKEARQIIDGQQRLSTLLMLMIILHQDLDSQFSKIESASTKAEDGEVAELFSWLAEQIAETQKQLLSCLAEERGAGDEQYRWLPKIVREIADIWSIRGNQSRYVSPIAHVLHTYVTANYFGTSFQLEVPTGSVIPEPAGTSTDDHRTLHNRFAQLNKYVKQVYRGVERDISESIELDLLLGDASVLSSLFDDPPSLTTTVVDAASKIYRRTPELLRTVVFARCMLDRVAITQINAKDESYAFDLFDSLNTTGEPLTALETFHPVVVDAEGRNDYPASPSFNHMSLTHALVAEHEGTVQRETARLITSFMLADAGRKVANRHNDQRRELAQRYRPTADLQAKRRMTRHLADVALTYFRVWERGVLQDRLDVEGTRLDPESLLCLEFLKHINHTVTVAPLARYFSSWRSNQSDATRDAVEQVIRASTAFSVLWRAAHGGTDGIDAVYRSLMQSGVQDVMTPLARTPATSHDERSLPDLSSFYGALWKQAAEHSEHGFTTRTEWVERVYARAIYDEQPELARFLLLLAAHHAIPDDRTGLTKTGAQADSTDMLNPARWDDERFATIEHVAPRNPPVDSRGEFAWPPEIYADPTIVNRIGNLALVPLDDNSALSNRGWSEKRSIYRALSADSPDEAKGSLDAAEEGGMDLTEEFKERILDERRHLPVLRAIAEREGEWDVGFINERGQHLLGRCWDVLVSWLPRP